MTLYIVLLVLFLIIFVLTILFIYKKYKAFHAKLDRIESNLVKEIKWQNHHSFQQLEALLSIYNFLKPVYPLPKSREWAASPDFLKLLFQIIVDEKPKTIVEAGSGLSSIIIGYTLKQFKINGKLISLDDKIQFTEKSREQIDKHELSDYVDIIHAPIQEYEENNKTFKWYSIESLENVKEIDLLIIDGPGPDVSDDPRYGALPLLLNNLSSNAVIILDDGARSGEQKIVNQWLKQFENLKSEYLDLEKGAYIIRKVI